MANFFSIKDGDTVRVTVVIPNGPYCEGCPFFDNGGGYKYEGYCDLVEARLDTLHILDRELTIRADNCPNPA